MLMLKSCAGGDMQEVHCDMSPVEVKEDVEKKGFFPIVAMLAIMPDTKLRVFKKCFGFAHVEQETIIRLEVGEMLIFRGDLAHSGVGYGADNYRVQTTVLCEDHKNPENATFATPFITYECEFCHKSFFKDSARKRHSSKCVKSTDVESVGALRAHTRDMERKKTTCPNCNKVFAKESYRKHKSRHKGKCQPSTQAKGASPTPSEMTKETKTPEEMP
ncbi:hypothetical protein Poli38472_014613 [Pythium oligandrum]|uniref:Uncharacterized protein n=1 Tax=Pythium oligandrum TaxID=41045 RepID=A0A8K1CN59_PYTOL|nr:hypothetical protein Poli38472_014613 [Pythium oligandrum]|eukprot:TMW66637.1 hypothetical protein Poli38472_014613 [Pythium oligandrum]